MMVNAAELKPGMRICIAGASSDIGQALLEVLAGSDMKIGAHYFSARKSLGRFIEAGDCAQTNIKLYDGDLSTQSACDSLIDSFVDWAGGIDSLIHLAGNVKNPSHWEELTADDWKADLDINLSAPFFLARRAMKYMKPYGGRIVLTSTASAKHGGGKFSMAYGVAKAGVECLVKGLAREGASSEILVNAVAPGFIETKFHTDRMKRNEQDLKERAKLVPLGRAGKPEDVARMVVYLISQGGNYITGECISVSGGDWL